MIPTAIGFYGKSKSGKTLLITQLIKRLIDEGFKVATIKRTDKKISIDSKDKDTWRHCQAGATTVVFSSQVETDFIIKEKTGLIDTIEQIKLFGLYDVILIEGADHPSIPKIRIGDIKERENTIFYYNENFEETVELIKKRIKENKKMKKEIVNIRVNGKAVPLTDFPSSFIKNTVIGMLKSLKGVKEINDVELSFEY